MKKNLYSLMLGLFLSITFAKLSFAQDINDVGENITDSVSLLPALIAGIAYLSGLVIAVTGILKIIDHVNNPSQTPARVPIIRFLIAGALFGLPIILEAAVTTINGGTATGFDPQGDLDIMTLVTGIGGFISMIPTLNTNINSVMDSMSRSVDLLPAVISAISYLLGLVIAVSALYKTRDHVEDPNKVPLKDAVIRYITAGALFALPTIYQAMYVTIVGDGTGIGGALAQVLTIVGAFVYSSEIDGVGCAAIGGTTVGSAVCHLMVNSISIAGFLKFIAHIIGLFFGVWGILKIRDHVNEPSRVGLSEGISRLIAGGVFFALPYIVGVIQYTVMPVGLAGVSLAAGLTGGTTTGYNNASLACGAGSTGSLDQAMGCFMLDIMGPTHVALNFFSYIAGMIFIMIGISRLIKSSQEGPKGPGGMGTMGTFLVGGLLLSATTILRAFSSSLFPTGGFATLFGVQTTTYAQMQYTTGMDPLEIQAAHNVISAVLQFLIVIGMISFVRGLFIMRDVAEGKGQASTMAGMTHMLGGALAVNMGPLLNAIQETLGITAFGVTFG